MIVTNLSEKICITVHKIGEKMERGLPSPLQENVVIGVIVS